MPASTVSGIFKLTDKLNNRHNGNFKMEAPSLISRGFIKLDLYLQSVLVISYLTSFFLKLVYYGISGGSMGEGEWVVKKTI